MSQVGRMREVVCAKISVYLQFEGRRCQYLSAYVAAAVMDWGRKPVGLVRLAVKVVTQNDGDFVEVMPLRSHYNV